MFFFYLVRISPFIDISELPKHITEYLAAFVSIVLGVILALIFRKRVLKPIHELVEATERISEGDYKIRLPLTGLKLIRMLTKKMNTMAAELDSIETLRSDFINNFSHEFKTPIVSIGGFAKILKSNSNLSEEERREYLDIIISESDRLANLSNNILTLTRLENQSILSHKSNFNVSEQIRLVIAMLEPKWREKNIDISFEGEDYNIYADKDLLQHIWTNVIDNAYKFSPADTEIKVAVRNIKNNKLIFTVADSGKGMSEFEAKHAFDKFYQGNVANKNSGNGIGLAVAKKICELHGGDIKIKYTGSGGSCFEITLPSE
ncbi:MAG: HAMP domain-containing histidine kinase [Clostridia bacterium]|nr:HAMP domain-containing histidine kinase [Clostridia bacterium]